ncbi:hypothetical protein TNCV_4753411 [Trichonephila clavipes]|nr:hypothetical protein TNCV_4753411 [Trichonephila clavipes]
MCPVLSKNTEQLNYHIEMEHDLKIEKEDLKFQNNEEFLIWKSKEENSKICKFVQHRGAEKRCVSSVNEQRPLAACKEKRQCKCNTHSERLCTE